MSVITKRVGLWLVGLAVAVGVATAADYVPKNSQKPGEAPPSPEEMLALMETPPGFEVTLFAGDPHIRQPVSMTFDDRGRLWVGEFYSYGEWERKGEDRVLVFEDTDGDGSFDKRTVFWDKANHLSSVLVGFGGVWILDSPEMLFIPDADGDLVPDGPPEIKLVGFTTEARHNLANGLSWGPDGWIYGRHGIIASSHVGLPGSAEADREPIDCGIWRYHPVRAEFEVVLNGMTNPWGNDWDEHGHHFLTGNVNGHLWHAIPGAYYERMHGAGRFPHVYRRLKMIAEKTHYDMTGWRGAIWQSVGREGDAEAGGGHSHCGGIIYQGENWPAEYRGDMLMCNTHGRRMNRDSLERQGAGFTSRYKGDVLKVNSPWFRGSGMVCGPGGSIFVSDWVDLGECHDHDGVHRTSGRIYKIRYTRGGGASWRGNVQSFSDKDLADLHASKNEWLVRRARRVLQERSLEGEIDPVAVAVLQVVLRDTTLPVPQRLRALWSLYVCGRTTENDLLKLLGDADEHARSWAVRLLCESGRVSSGATEELVAKADSDPSPLVRLYLASSSLRLPLEQAWPVVEKLIAHGVDASDRDLPLVYWAALEPLVSADPERAVRGLKGCAIPELRKFLARRLASGLVLDPLVNMLGSVGGDRQRELLRGMAAGLGGREGVSAPSGWSGVAVRLLDTGDGEICDLVANLSAVFQDQEIMGRLAAGVRDGALPLSRRQGALRALVHSGNVGSREILEYAFGDPGLRVEAITAFGRLGGMETADFLLGAFGDLSGQERSLVVSTLVSRKDWAARLLQAVRVGDISSHALSPEHAQAIAAHRSADLRKLLSDHWGQVVLPDEEKVKKIAHYRELITTAAGRNPDPVRGKAVFGRACAACHQLFGEGGNAGPDLTGSGRKELDYILQNVIDPSASVPKTYQVTTLQLHDGRVLTGTISRETAATITIRSVAGEETVDRAGVEKIVRSRQSIMPEGLFDILTPDEVRDLVAYLVS